VEWIHSEGSESATWMRARVARARRPSARALRKRRASRVFAPPAIVRRAFVASARRCARQCGRASVETDRVVSAWKT
jgi:hypothetical protein